MTDVVTVVETEVVVTSESTADVITVGIQGPPGPPGTSGDKHYEQAFTNQSTITVNHNLGKYPAVTVITSAGDEVEGDIDHLDANSLTVTFSSATGGVVHCN